MQASDLESNPSHVEMNGWESESDSEEFVLVWLVLQRTAEQTGQQLYEEFIKKYPEFIHRGVRCTTYTIEKVSDYN